MTIAISIVSHGHFDLIKSLGVVERLAFDSDFKVVICDNTGEPGFKDWCDRLKVLYIENSVQRGFGENNNKVYGFLENSNDLIDNDFFLVLNPDVDVDGVSIKELAKCARECGAKISTLNLYCNMDQKIYDYSVRNFPNLRDFVTSLIFNYNPTLLDKSKISSPCCVDWAAGSFLLFDVAHYHKLGGFDEKYYMYCEDIDICMRSYHLFNERVFFFPEIAATHLARHKSKSNILSKHFWWHIGSAVRYICRRRRFGVM